MRTIILTLLLLVSIKGFSQTYPYKQWQQNYKPVNADVRVNDSKIDNSGNLIVTGNRDSSNGSSTFPKGGYVTKFKKQGGMEWTVTNSGYHSSFNALRLNAVDTDNQNNVYAAGRSDSISFFGKKASLYKYNSAGALQWEKHIGISPYYEECSFTDAGVDAQGNIIAAGYVVTSTGGADTIKLLLAKYNASGTLLWMKIHLYQKFCGYSAKIAFDNNSNIFVFHEGKTFVDKSVVMMSKFNSAGIQQWDFYYQGSSFTGFDYTYDLKVGPDGNPVFYYLLNNASPSYSTVYVTKLTSAGGEVFHKGYGVAFNAAEEFPGNLVINNSNEVLFCYSSQTSPSLNYEGFIYKLSTAGNEIWSRTFNIGSMSADYIENIGVDSDNNVYALGYSAGTAKGYIVKYDNNGIKKMETTFKPDAFYNFFSAMHIGVNKEIYIAHTSYINFGYEATAYKYIQVPGQIIQPPSRVTAKPVTDFTDTYDTLNVTGIPSSAIVLRMEVKLDSIKHTYPHDLTFHLTNPSGYKDSIVKEPGGFFAGMGYFRTILSDTASKIIDSASSPFTGYFRPSRSLSAYNYLKAGGNWILRIRDNAEGDTGSLYKWGLIITYYDTLLTEIKTINISNVPNGYWLSQNYPNPFNPTTKINFNLPSDARVELSIFDITGRLVQTVISSENFSAGYHTVQFNGSSLSSGTYFYRMKAGDFTETKKMLLIK
jgi:subtilisin-like proprotein convertase family protein